MIIKIGRWELLIWEPKEETQTGLGKIDRGEIREGGWLK